MAKNPVFPLYYNDFLGSTITWTDEEVGAYIRLLIYQWDSKELPKDYQRLTRIATSMDTNWPTIKNKFTETETGYINTNLEVIRTKQLIFKEKQKNNVLKRYQKPTKPSTKNLPLEIEIENEIENEEVIELEKESLREKTENQDLKNPNYEEIVFETFRRKYPGTKHGIEKEFSNFKRHKDWVYSLPKLIPALETEINWRIEKTKSGGFVPDWKHLSTWINQRCWEQELSEVTMIPNKTEFKKPDLRINSGVVDRGTEIANQMRLDRELEKVKV